MELTSTIQSIGAGAIDNQDTMVILFGEKATPELRDVSVIQMFDDPKAQKTMAMRTGDHVTINDIKYRVAGVGNLTNANLQQIGHCTLVFQPVPSEDQLGNALYLTPNAVPVFEVGAQIIYTLQD